MILTFVDEAPCCRGILHTKGTDSSCHKSIWILVGSVFAGRLMTCENTKLPNSVIMNLIQIEESAFDTMMARLERFTDKVELICNRLSDKSLNHWLDNQDVCQILDIKTRTLQTYRDSGKIAFRKIGRKIFYRPEDVLKLYNKEQL